MVRELCLELVRGLVVDVLAGGKGGTVDGVGETGLQDEGDGRGGLEVMLHRMRVECRLRGLGSRLLALK